VYNYDAKSDPDRIIAASIYQVFWAANGMKVREDQVIIPPDPLKISSSSFYTLNSFNGEKSQTWEYGSPVASVSANGPEVYFGESSTVLQLSIGQDATYLSENLKSYHPYFIGKEDISGIETYKIEAQPTINDNEVKTWWIAPKLSFLVLKHERKILHEIGGKSTVIARHVLIVDEVSEIDKIWVPTSSRYIIYISPQGQNERWKTLFKSKVMTLKINKEVPAQIFDLPLPPGTRIGEGEFTGESYTIAGSKEEFENKLKNEKLSGKQPDLESEILSSLRPLLSLRGPNKKALLDLPTDGKIKIVQIRDSL
jgi:hypothetical protein